MAPSKAKSRQTWCNQTKRQRRTEAASAGQETSRETQRKTLHEIPAKASTSRVTPLSLDTESSADGESSCRFLVERSDEHVTRDRNPLAQSEIPKRKRHLTRGNKRTLFQQKAWEGELCDDSDATVCEPHAVQRSPRQYTPKGREASTTAAEPQTDVLNTDDQSQTGQTEFEPESQNILISDANNDSVCSETRVKKRKKKKKDRVHGSIEDKMGQRQEEPEGLHAAKSVNVEVEETPSLSDNRAKPPTSQTSDELDYNETNCMDNSVSHDDTIVRQEERDIPESKKEKRKKSAAQNVRQEVDGNLELDVRMEDSVISVSCNVENGGKKKKRRKRREEDVEQLQSSAADEPLNDGAGVQLKKKKRKKDKTIVAAEECEEKEARNMSTGQLEESGNGLESQASSQGTLESSNVKKKKKLKKKRQSSSNDATRDTEDAVDVSFSNDAATLEESTGKSLMKKKTISDGVDISNTPEENEKVEDTTQKANEGLEDQNAELVTKKKKKKKISSRTTSDDSVAQSDDSVSVRKKEKKRTSSFLVADVEEKDEQNSASQSVDAHVWGAENPSVSASDFETESAEIAGNLEESNDGVRQRKKKRKRKMSEKQDGVEKDHKRDFEELNKTCALPETTDTGVKRKNKCVRDEIDLRTSMERLESAADSGHSPTDKDVVLKKKKGKCKDEPCRVIESPLTATEDTESEKLTLNTCSVVSHQKKGKRLTFPVVSKGEHGRSADMSQASSTFDQASKETLNMFEQASPSSDTPGKQALRDKKKMKSPDNILLRGMSLSKSAELEPKEKSVVPKSVTSNPVLSEISISKCEMSSSDSIMNKKHKRKLYNPSEDFLTDLSA